MAPTRSPGHTPQPVAAPKKSLLHRREYAHPAITSLRTQPKQGQPGPVGKLASDRLAGGREHVRRLDDWHGAHHPAWPKQNSASLPQRQSSPSSLRLVWQSPAHRERVRMGAIRCRITHPQRTSMRPSTRPGSNSNNPMDGTTLNRRLPAAPGLKNVSPPRSSWNAMWLWPKTTKSAPCLR